MKTTPLQGAIINGTINAVINGAIKWFSFREYETVPISVDSITNQEFTVLGNAVHLSVTLAMVLTFVAYFSIKKEMRPKMTRFLGLVLKHGFFTFGVATGLAVLWQYKVGTVEVSALTGTLLVGLIAGVVAGVVNYLTLKPYSATLP